MNTVHDSLAQLRLEFENRLRGMAKEQEAAVALAFARQRQQASQQNWLIRQLSTMVMAGVSQWFTHKLQGKQAGGRLGNAEEVFEPGVNAADVLIVDVEYRVIEDDPQTRKTTQGVRVWVS